MSLRTKLVLLVLLLTTTLLTCLGLYVGSSLRAWTLEVVDDELRARAEVLVHEIHLEGEALEVDDDDDLGARGLPFRVETETGQALLGAPGEWATLPRDGLANVEEHGLPLRVLSRRFVPREGDAHPPLVLRVAAPLTAVSGLATRFRSGLVLALLLAMVLGAAGATLMARVLLAPLQRLTRAVDEINELSLERPLDTRGLAPELERLATTFNAMLTRLAAAFAAQRTFVARASHALRTPLASILSQAEVSLLRERAPEAYRAALQDIGAAARESSRLAEGLLALSRADAVTPEQKSDFTGAALADEVQRLFAARAQTLGLRFSTRASEGLVLHATRSRVREMVDALVDNALRYTPRGGEVRFAVRREGAHIALEVADSGPGVQADERAQVFERFFRGRASVGTPGNGLGLSVVRALAEAEGAQVTVQSPPGGGAQFVVTLAC